MAGRIKKYRWPENGLLQFPLGLDTFHPDGFSMPDALSEAQNIESPLLGAWETRRGRVRLLTMPDVNAPVQGMYELARVDGEVVLMLVQNGKLYRESAGSVVEIPIRKYKPYPPYPDDNSNGERLNGNPLVGAVVKTAGTAGANLVALRTYRYAVHGVDATGGTQISAQTATMQVTLGATAHPVDITVHGCYGMTSYVVWRSESTDGGVTWSAWGRMATGVNHTTIGGKTLVQWTDDGNTAPNTGVSIPSANTTKHLLDTTNRVDWETWDGSWDGENAAYFVNGNGICRTDGTRAEVVTPTDPATYLETNTAGPGINALGDVTWPGHTTRGLIRHHAYLFFGDVSDKPNVFYYSRALDPCHVPQIAAIEVPARGGRILDFKVKDTNLGVGATTGFWTLLGTSFNPFQPSGDVYFSEATDIGAASEWSIIRSDIGMLQYISQQRKLIGVANLMPDKERTQPVDLGLPIQPTLNELADMENAVSLWSDGQWFLSFPDDQKLIRIYQRATAGGLVSSPVIDTGTSLGALIRRRDGTVLGAHPSMGLVYKLQQPNVYTDDGVGYTCRLQTRKLDFGFPGRVKKVRWCRPYYTCLGQVELHYRFETIDGIVEGSVILAGTGGYDEGMYDVATYDPWTLPYEELDIGEEGPHLQATFWWTGGFLRIYGLLFELDVKR